MYPSLPFIGRQDDLETVDTILSQAASMRRGRIVFIEGGVGMGKSFFLDEMKRRSSQTKTIENAQFASAFCDSLSGTESAYQPFIEIIDELYESSRDNKEKTKKILSIIQELGPDWLELIPVVGTALSLGVKTATRIKETYVGTDDDITANRSITIAAQYVEIINKIASQHELLCFVVGAAQWIDEVSCKILLRLAYQLNEQPIVVVLSYEPGEIKKTHPFSKVQHEIKLKHRPVVIKMKNFTKPEIDQYVQKRFGTSLHPNLPCWLLQLCRGRPLFVSQYLDLLEQNKVIQRKNNSYVFDGRIINLGGRCQPEGTLAHLSTPSNVKEVIEQRIQRLHEDEQRLLEIGAVQGEQFISAVLAKLVEKDELNILKQLRRVVEQEGVVQYSSEDWARATSQTYAFEHMLTHQIFYKQMSPAERVRYHRDIAAELKLLLKDRSKLTHKLRIELARHYDLGKMYLEAAKYYYFAARAIFGSGAYGETIQLCQKSLKNARKLSEGDLKYDKLRVRIILLLLRASEMRWRGNTEDHGRLPLDELIDEAEKAALRTGDKALLAQITFIKGIAYVSTRSLPEAITVLRQAFQIARSIEDAVLEFSILSFLGHQTVAQDLEKGLTLQYQALQIYRERIEGTPKDKRRRGLRRAYYSLHGHIGVGEFDRGNYSIAEKELRVCIFGIRQLRLKEHLVAPLNFISQLYMAMGQFKKAENLIKKSIAIFQDDPENNPWRAYNRALLGKLYLEWQRVNEAVDPIIQGWEETHATRNVWLIGLVRNYYAELLMHPEYRSQDLELAKQLLSETIKETRISGFHRSGIWAESQMGQLELMKQNHTRALEYSTKAVQYLEKIGIMPALRAEEIYYNHFRVLQAVGYDTEAMQYCDKARNILRQKEVSIRKESYRKSFLTIVPLSRSISKACGT